MILSLTPPFERGASRGFALIVDQCPVEDDAPCAQGRGCCKRPIYAREENEKKNPRTFIKEPPLVDPFWALRHLYDTSKVNMKINSVSHLLYRILSHAKASGKKVMSHQIVCYYPYIILRYLTTNEINNPIPNIYPRV